MKYQKEKLEEKIPFAIGTKKKKPNIVLRNKPNQGGKRPALRELHNTEGRN